MDKQQFFGRFTASSLLGFFVVIFLFPNWAEAQIVIAPPCDPIFNPGPECRDPVLIIPGLAASHNRERILKDHLGGTWDFTPMVNWYEPLIERLEAEGFTLGQDLFVVHYDWRQENLRSAIEYLIPAIEQAKQSTGSNKVDLVTHSMGGVVARAYLESPNLYNDDVDQLIVLGTPNEGAADAYVAWEGGFFPDRWNWAERAWMGRIERGLG